VWVDGGTHALHHSHSSDFNEAVAAFASALDAEGQAT